MRAFSIFTLAALLSVSCLAAEPAVIPPSKELSKLNQLIEKIRSVLTADKGKQSELNQQLQTTEKSISTISGRLKKINEDLLKQNSNLMALQEKQQRSEQELKRQKDFLTQQVMSVYKLERQQKMVNVLQQPPAAISRMLSYFNYLSQARVNYMQGLNQSMQQLLATHQQLAKEKVSLQHLLAQHRQQQSLLQSSQKNKKTMLTSISTKIQVNNQQLVHLIADKQALEKLLKKLQAQAKASKMRFTQGGVPIAKLAGKLPWPTNARVSRRFQQQDSNGLKYNGVLLAAPIGQAVQAIYPGRVIFADWLQGFGQVLIIDHGKGYMSLYGRNQKLTKKTGDIVGAGDLVAMVGNSGGHEQAGLYFEIRHNGRPSNPENWCRSGIKKS